MIDVALQQNGRSTVVPYPRIFEGDVRSIDGFCNHKMEWGALGLMLATAVILSAIVFAASESALAANLTATASLIIALGTAGRVFVAFQKHKALVERQRAEEAHARELEREEHGRTVERLDRMTERYAEIQVTVDNLERKLDDSERRAEELEFRANDQAKQLDTMHSLLNEFGIAIKEDGVTSVRLIALWRQYELVQRKKQSGDTP